LPLFLRDQYQISPVTAGYLTAVAAFVGSGVRPLGGYLADRLGGVRMLSMLLLGIGSIYALASQLPSLEVLLGLVVAGMACLGMGNGATFQLVPQRFPKEIGVATGVIGAFGGLGGFFLPNLLGNVKGFSGSFGPGFLALGGFAFGAFLLVRFLVLVGDGWRLSWRVPTEGGLRPAPASEGRVLMAPYLQP
jgi:MFS transporter, NNP family, nitrate/nitrite transporter